MKTTLLPFAIAAMVLAPGVSAARAQDAAEHQTAWQLSARAMAPVTTTDPQHVAVGVGLSWTGAARGDIEYQPRPHGRLGMIRAALGARVLRRPGWTLSVDIEHTQVRANRRLFQGQGWELDGHDRHQLSLGTAILAWQDKRILGVVSGVEAGAGRLHIWRLVSARAGGGELNDTPDPILESAVPVGMLGVYAQRRLFWGLHGAAHSRLVVAGKSRGGEVPFAHAIVEWELTHQIFGSSGGRRGVLGVTGNHATSPQAAAYFQNGVGVAFRMEFR